MGEQGVRELNLRVSDAREFLSRALDRYGRLTYASSLGCEAVVLTDLIAPFGPSIDIFTIDTGRLHEETHKLLEALQRLYPSRIRVVHPDASALEQLVARRGVNGFYDSVEARLECCRIRKVEPFKRAIAGFPAWITGIRRRHSADRAESQPMAWDDEHGLYKVSPLLEWHDEEIWHYIRTRGLPYNRLHDLGYPSIGCAPCTRAIQDGEDFRAGRWWWERPGSRECGLVSIGVPDPRPRRAVPDYPASRSSSC
jgi:phosphoadenosine phosphosulfate reductase